MFLGVVGVPTALAYFLPATAVLLGVALGGLAVWVAWVLHYS